MNNGNEAVYCLSAARFSLYQSILVCFFIYFTQVAGIFVKISVGMYPHGGSGVFALLSSLNEG